MFDKPTLESLTFLEKDLQAEREYDTIPLLFENENGFL